MGSVKDCFNIFILENNLNTRKLFDRYFADNGAFSLNQAATTQGALQYLETAGAAVDLFLVDTDLPDAKGLEFLRSASHFKQAKFVVISRTIIRELQKIIDPSKLVKHLIKPFSLQDLDNAMKYMNETH